MALSKREFDSLKPKAKEYSVTDGGGLNVKVLPDGRKIWFLMYRTGKRQRKFTFGEISPTDARQQMLEAKAKLAQGVDPQAELQLTEAQQMTFGEFVAERYKPYLEANHSNPDASYWVLEHCFKSFWRLPMAQLSLSHVQQWHNRNKQLAPATVNRRVGALKATLEKARLWGYIPANPLTDWKKVKVPKVPVEFLTEDQIQVLYDALIARDKRRKQQRVEYNKWLSDRGQQLLPDYDQLGIMFTDYLTPLVLLVLNTGLRFDEAISLKWSDISDGVLTAKSSKTGNFRYIPLTSDTDAMLKELKQLNAANTGEQSANVFLNNDGRSLKSVKTAWNNVRKQLPFDCDFRMLRRTYGSRLVQKGVPVYTVSQLLGHTNVQTTQRWYLSLDLDAYKQAVRAIDEYMAV